MEFCLKYLGVIIFTIPALCFAEYTTSYEVEDEFSWDNDQFIAQKPGRMMTETRDALLSYELVHEKTTYWGKRFERALFGDHVEKFLIFTPLVTGKLEFRAMDLDFYVDARKSKGGVKYTYNF